MASFDNTSMQETLEILFQGDLSSPDTSVTVDTSNYVSYNITISAGLPAAGNYDNTVTIETSDTLAGTFTAVANDKLIGGDNVIEVGTNPPDIDPSEGTRVIQRGVIDGKGFVRVTTVSNAAPSAGTSLTILSIGNLKVAPSQVTEGTTP